MAVLLGLVNDDFHTDQFDEKEIRCRKARPRRIRFIERDWRLIGDSYRATRELTLNFGVRYENFRPLYEASGTRRSNGRAQPVLRDALLSLKPRVPQNAMPNAILNWDLNGPVNGKPTWWKPSNLNLAPRIGFAYGPQNRGGLLGKLFGKSGAFRAGAGMVYDRFGSDLVAQYDQYGSIGLATAANFADSYSFSTSPRFNGLAPELPANPLQPFPYTPPAIAAIAGDF